MNTSKLDNYLNYRQKFERMDALVDDWAIEYHLEKFKPLIDDGFEYEEIMEYFAVKLNDYIFKLENENGGK